MITKPFVIQEKKNVKTEIGDYAPEWSDTGNVNGILDLITGTDVNDAQNAITEQSTHVLIIQPVPSFKIDDTMRVIENDRWYSITYADDPAGQAHHLELYLTLGGEL